MGVIHSLGTARSRSWQHAGVETSGCTSKAREIHRINERVRAGDRERVCAHTVTKIPSGPEHPDPGTQRRLKGHIKHRMWLSQWWEVPDGYNGMENECQNRNGMSWGRYTRRENGESSLKGKINK